MLEYLKVMGKPRNEFPKFNTEKLAERIVYAVKVKKRKEHKKNRLFHLIFLLLQLKLIIGKKRRNRT